MQKNVLKKLFISHKWDLLLGAVLLLVALCLFLVFNNSKKIGTYVEVTRNKKIVAKYPLDKDAEYVFSDFSGSNTLIIKDGKAYVTDCTCPDKICEKMGSICTEGEMIVCIPNGLFIKVINGKESDYDAVAN